MDSTVRDTQEMKAVNFEDLEPVGEVIGEEHIIFIEEEKGKKVAYYIGTVCMHEGNFLSIKRFPKFPKTSEGIREISFIELQKAGLELQVSLTFEKLCSRINKNRPTQKTFALSDKVLEAIDLPLPHFSMPIIYEAHFKRLPASYYIGTLQIIDEDFKLRFVFDKYFYKDPYIIRNLHPVSWDSLSKSEINLVLYTYLDFLTENSSELSARFKLNWMSLCPSLSRVKSLIEINTSDVMHQKLIWIQHAQEGILPFLNYIHPL